MTRALPCVKFVGEYGSKYAYDTKKGEGCSPPHPIACAVGLVVGSSLKPRTPPPCVPQNRSCTAKRPSLVLVQRYQVVVMKIRHGETEWTMHFHVSNLAFRLSSSNPDLLMCSHVAEMAMALSSSLSAQLLGQMRSDLRTCSHVGDLTGGRNNASQIDQVRFFACA